MLNIDLSPFCLQSSTRIFGRYELPAARKKLILDDLALAVILLLIPLTIISQQTLRKNLGILRNLSLEATQIHLSKTKVMDLDILYIFNKIKQKYGPVLFSFD